MKCQFFRGVSPSNLGDRERERCEGILNIPLALVIAIICFTVIEYQSNLVRQLQTAQIDIGRIPTRYRLIVM